VQELFERGLITGEELQLHPERNVVTRVVSAVPVDPDFVEFTLRRGTLVLCTDGLTGALSDAEIFSEIQGTDRRAPDMPKPHRTCPRNSRG